MKGENINNRGRKSRVLVAPLDWGLGHSTRCIPIINMLLNQNCEVYIAVEGQSRLLLEKEYKNIVFLDTQGYRIRYSRKKSGMALKLLAQVPKLIYSIYRENSQLKKIVRSYSIDAVIADNRLGMYHSSIPSVYITHQLKIKTGFRFTEWIAQKIHYWFINKYTECWVPDTIGTPNLAGELSHPDKLPDVRVQYIGPLSRFEKTTVEIKYDLTVILSGPEPQRTVFEKMILKDIENYDGKVLLIRGLPDESSLLKNTFSQLIIKNHLPAAELNLAIQQSALIISRCGYTSVMDLVKLQKNAILIPTPGQTEQEYLAGYLGNQKIFLCIKQPFFSLPEVVKEAAGFSFNKTAVPQDEYEIVVKKFLKKYGLIEG